MLGMDELYVVFDQIPLKKDGGLIATYIDFVKELSADYRIVFISVFRSEPTDIEEFKNLEVITLFDIPLDNRFYRVLEYAKQQKYRACVFSFISAVRFFWHIPFGRLKTKRLLHGNKVIAVAPAAAMFLSKSCRYILEIHTNFEYFWGHNLLGRAQSALIHQPALTLFRSKADAKKGDKLFPSSYLYNTFDAAALPSPTLKDALSHRAIYMGRLSEQKNPLMLLDCAEGMINKFPDFNLDIYGEGDLKDELRDEIKARGLGKHVHLKGFTRDKAIYREYDMLWLTSRLEGLCLAIIEAAANMVPTVSTEWGDAVYEEIINGASGYVVSNRDEFVERSIELMTSLEKRNRMALEAYRLYNERFSIEAHRNAWIDAIQNVYKN